MLADGPPPARTVVFAALGSEELGMEGAYALMDDPPAGFDPSQVVYNLNMDMIGTYDQTEVVWALGAFRGTEGAAAVQAEMQAFPDLDVALNEPSDLSDNAAFCEPGSPTCSCGPRTRAATTRPATPPTALTSSTWCRSRI